MNAIETARQCAVALLTATCDGGYAPTAFVRAMQIAGCREHEPGRPPGPTVIEAIAAEIEACRRDPDVTPSEWHFGLAATKAVNAEGSFALFLPSPPSDTAAPQLYLQRERQDVLPAYAIRDCADLWR